MLGTSKNIWGFDPRSVPGCSLWLDGADPAGTGVLPANGTTLTTWKDKSVSNFPFTSLGSSYNTTAVNGLPGINISTNPFGYNPGSAQNNWQEVFAVGLWTGGSTFNTYNGFISSYGENDNQAGGGIIFIGDSGTTNWYNINAYQTPFLNGIQTNTALPTIQTPFCIRTHSTSAVNVTGLQLGVDRANGRNWVGFISEVLVYNTALTTSQRQQVEGYLAWKWGLTTSVPSIHPFSSIRPHLRTFQPTDIPGCQLWLDAADQSSLVLSGSNVTQWNDKSGNGKNATATGTPTYVTGGGVNFNGSSYFLNQAFTMNLSQRSIFIVMQETTHTDFYGVLPFIPDPNSGNDSTTANGLSIETKNGLRFYANSGGYTSDIGNTTLLVKAIYNDNMNVTTGSGFVNGTNVINANANYTAGTCSGYGVGGRWLSGSMSGSYRLNGVIYEIIIFNTPLTTSQRQSIEGYLAHKWGLTTPIPSTHPFKSILPATAAHFSPMDITGITLWLDGADPAGTGVLPANGATVSTWVDKSGNGLTVSAASSQPTYVTNAANGLGTVAFNGTQSLSAGTVTGTKLIGNTGSCAIYVVVRFANISERSSPYTWDNSNYTERLLMHQENSIIYIDKGNLSAGNARTQVSVSITNTLYYIISYSQNGSNTQINLNGTTVTSLSNFSNSSIASTSQVFNVGSYINGSDWNMKGNIAEILFFNTHIPNDFKKVEGYLAHKWGLASSLPTTHSFKKFSPGT